MLHGSYKHTICTLLNSGLNPFLGHQRSGLTLKYDLRLLILLFEEIKERFKIISENTIVRYGSVNTTHRISILLRNCLFIYSYITNILYNKLNNACCISLPSFLLERNTIHQIIMMKCRNRQRLYLFR